MLSGSQCATCQVQNESNKSSSRGPCETCGNTCLGGNLRCMDKEIRKSKGANKAMTRGRRGHLT